MVKKEKGNKKGIKSGGKKVELKGTIREEDELKEEREVKEERFWKFNKEVKVIPMGAEVKVYRFLGYCKCGCQITSGDLEKKSVDESKAVYICPGCSKRERIGRLVKERVVEKASNQKEYMEGIPNTESSYVEEIPIELVKKLSEEE
jgi:hypothetical protein